MTQKDEFDVSPPFLSPFWSAVCVFCCWSQPKLDSQRCYSHGFLGTYTECSRVQGYRTELESWGAGNMPTWSHNSSHLQGFSSTIEGRGRRKYGGRTQGQASPALLLELITRSSWLSCAFFLSLLLLPTFQLDVASPHFWARVKMFLLHFSQAGIAYGLEREIVTLYWAVALVHWPGHRAKRLTHTHPQAHPPDVAAG